MNTGDNLKKATGECQVHVESESRSEREVSVPVVRMERSLFHKSIEILSMYFS